MAFCAANNPAYFDMQSALMSSKKIWQLLGTTFGSGQRPPVVLLESYIFSNPTTTTVHTQLSTSGVVSSTDLLHAATRAPGCMSPALPNIICETGQMFHIGLAASVAVPCGVIAPVVATYVMVISWFSCCTNWPFSHGRSGQTMMASRMTWMTSTLTKWDAPQL